MKILITGGKSSIALKLSRAVEGNELLMADYGEMPLIQSKLYSFVALGDLNGEVIAHNLLTTCLNENISLLLPLYKFEIIALAKAEVLFEEFAVRLLLPTIADDFLTNGISRQNWMVFDRGETIFYTLADQELMAKGKMLHWSGAYYFDPETKVLEPMVI